MSSPNGTLMQAVRGPVLLIALGVLLTIDHFGPYGFWRTWPALLILFGLLKLLERMTAERPAGPGGEGAKLP